MKLEEIRSLTDSDLQRLVAVKGESLFRIRFQKSLGELGGLKQLRSLKVDLARSKTVLRARAIETASRKERGAIVTQDGDATRAGRIQQRGVSHAK